MIGRMQKGGQKPLALVMDADGTFGSSIAQGFVRREDAEQIRSFFELSKLCGLKLESIIHSASVMSGGNIMEVSLQEWDNILNLVFCTAWRCMQQAAALMKKNDSFMKISDGGAGRERAGYSGQNLGECSCIWIDLGRMGYSLREKAAAFPADVPEDIIQDCDYQLL